MADTPDYDTMPFEELRHKAISLAEHRGDVKFLWGLVEHSQGATAMATEGGDLGGIGGSVSDAVAAAHEVFGEKSEATGLEPMYRVVFTDYLTKHAK